MRIKLFTLIILSIVIEQSIATDYKAKGVIFNQKAQILLAEKFINVEFLVPFPNYTFTAQKSIETTLQKLSQMWKTPSAFCQLDFSNKFNSSLKDFNLAWLLDKIATENETARLEVELIRNETAAFLTSGEEFGRQKRGAHVGAALLAGVGLFGGGLLLGNSGSCGIAGIFGNCQNYGRQNAENIDRLNEFASALTDYVLEVESESNEKFFLISDELREIKRIQEEMQSNQNKNWEIIEKQFGVIDENFHILRDCNQVLFANQQLNFNFDTVASFLSLIYSDIKSYRAALFAYKVNMQNSIPILLQKRLPMSLVPRDSLLAILNSVYDSQKSADDRLTLAIPMSDLLSYYDAKLLSEISTVKQGILLTLAIPLASSQTEFTVYEAQLIPMPQRDSSEAIQWIIEGPYLAISDDSMETTVLSEFQYQNCLGSSRYRICHQTMETNLGSSTCLSTLYFHNTLTALTICDTEKILLPTPEKATNLGYGIWLITSASNSFTLREYSIKSDSVPRDKDHKGCHVCIITLECGTQLISKNIKIRPDLTSCETLPATRIDVQLPTPLETIISHVPKIDQLPYYESPADANIAMLNSVKRTLSRTAINIEMKQLDEIAKPIGHEMTLLRPTLVEKLEMYVPIKLSLSLTLIVFILNLILHALFMYLYHRFAIFKKLTPKFLQSNTMNANLTQSTISVANQQLTPSKFSTPHNSELAIHEDVERKTDSTL